MKSPGSLAWLLVMSVSACGAASRAEAPRGSVASPASGAPSGAAVQDAAAREDDGVPASSGPVWGSPTALVTVVEFADFECPFCARAEATLATARQVYGPDTLRIVWKNMPLPFHEDALPAAEAAMGVFFMKGSEAFWRFHDAALQGVGALGSVPPAAGQSAATGLGAPEPESPPHAAAYARWAKDAGVDDVVAFRSGLATGKWKGAVARDQREAKALGLSGTPSFFVNGIRVVGAQPFDVFRTVIDEQVRAAKAKLAAGTFADRVYAVLSRENMAHAPADDDDAGPDDSKTVYWVPLGKSPTRGSAEALVTLVEFADYECPFCARAEPTVKALRDEYGDKLRVVFKDAPLPFHARAEPAAEAALEVRAERGDAAFWSMHDALLDGPRSPDDAALDDTALEQLASRFGARDGAVKRAIARHSHTSAIEDDLSLADDLGADGTPHFFINGRRLVGAQPKEMFEEIIDEEMARARALLSAGTTPAALYDALVRDGARPPGPEKKAIGAAAIARTGPRAPTRGSATAKVTIHEWSDFQCPFCARAEATLERVLERYRDDIKLVWHDLPLPMHPLAPLAGQAAREALNQKGAGAFWAIHDEMLSHQGDLGREALDGYARALGLDMGRWKTALDGGVHAADMEADRKAAAELGISGTPAFVVVPAGKESGYFIGGAQGYMKFRKIIERARAEAK